jgi:hypothetical protein
MDNRGFATDNDFIDIKARAAHGKVSLTEGYNPLIYLGGS